MSANDDKLKQLLEKANTLPFCPGVYIMKNSAGKVIYVGKSRKLKSRVSQYFQNSAKNIKTSRMVSLVDNFDYIVCNTEIEALTLENTLIKQYTPKYNIKLKDAKSYPYIKITNEEYPRIIFTRTRLNDKAKYFGPYSGTSTVFSVLSLLNKSLGIPSCKRKFPRDIGKERPCIYRQMKQCCGVCAGDVSVEEYNDLIKSAAEILRGNISKARHAIEEEMFKYAEAENFEAAIRCRNTINALEKLTEKQKVVSSSHIDHDVFGIYSSDICTAISILNVREGVLVNKSDYVFGSDRVVDDSSIGSFLCDYYRGKDDIPREVLLSFELDSEERELVEAYLKTLVGMNVEVRTPERGDKKALAGIAVNNAEQAANRYVSDSEKSDTLLASLAETLGLEVLPSRIEAYDISNLGSEHKTAGMIVCEDGKLKKSDYRSFIIKTVEGTDDYASMQEAIKRRFEHLEDESGSFSNLPDLVLLDGGKTHVACVRRTLCEMGIEVPVFGMVKDEYHKTRSLCDEENEISIASDKELFVFIYKIQEEIHRFTVSKMTAAKLKTLKTSSLEKIKGIGEKKAKAILLKFGTLDAVKNASVKELSEVKGVSVKDAESVYAHFHQSEEK
ncbi:MAG: excinuclease ABC subunit UvrC [Clostridia bacterium]|nr:excinuclease ABC subunit UvrC [Clostridia bacterium]